MRANAVIILYLRNAFLSVQRILIHRKVVSNITPCRLPTYTQPFQLRSRHTPLLCLSSSVTDTAKCS